MKTLFPFFLLAIFLLPACETAKNFRGNDAPPDKLKKIIIGKSKREDVVKALGSPQYLSFYDNKLWLYISSEASVPLPTFEFIDKRRVVVIYFNDEDVVTRKRVLGLDQGEDIAFVQQTTPSPVPERNWVEQLFGNIGRVTPAGIPGGGGTGPR